MIGKMDFLVLVGATVFEASSDRATAHGAWRPIVVADVLGGDCCGGTQKAHRRRCAQAVECRQKAPAE
jgi:hypothetical protein